MQFVNQYSWRAFNFFLSSSSCDITPLGTQLIFHPPQKLPPLLRPLAWKRNKNNTETAREAREGTQKFLSYFFYLLKLNVPFLTPCPYAAMQPPQLREVQKNGIVFGNITRKVNSAKSSNRHGSLYLAHRISLGSQSTELHWLITSFNTKKAQKIKLKAER